MFVRMFNDLSGNYVLHLLLALYVHKYIYVAGINLAKLGTLYAET